MSGAAAPARRGALWILGAGGHGRVVADAAEVAGRHDEIVFFDDDAARAAQVSPRAFGGDHAAFLAGHGAGPGIERHVAIGDNGTRERFVRRCEEAGLALATVVHPAAVVSRDATLGAGGFVAAGAVVVADVPDDECVVGNPARPLPPRGPAPDPSPPRAPTDA